jgi:glycogen(starch) synthase
MRIAFISWEFPPETGGGGIGTYLEQAVTMITEAGHEVHVFCGSPVASFRQPIESGMIHRIHCPERFGFREKVVPFFLKAHKQNPFDVMEGTDFGADGLEVKNQIPELPYVCKLHTPSFLINELHYRKPRWPARIRMAAGALRKGQSPKITPKQVDQNDPEVQAIRRADHVAATTKTIGNWARQRLSIPEEKISTFPYPFQPRRRLLEISHFPKDPHILFIGRLEERKGVMELIEAFRNVAKNIPEARLTLIGKSMHSPDGRTSMEKYLISRLGSYADRSEFCGAMDQDAVAAALEQSAVCLFPSRWESFGLVCCEAMAAARPLIVCRGTGMAEVTGSEAAIHVSPKSVSEISEALQRLLHHPPLREKMGSAGRKRVQSSFSFTTVLPLQLDGYHSAISACGSTIRKP